MFILCENINIEMQRVKPHLEHFIEYTNTIVGKKQDYMAKMQSYANSVRITRCWTT